MNEMVVVPEVAQSRALTAADVRQHVNLIQQVMQGIMKEGTHFGTIPGCKQPSLYKAGSEVLLTTFRISVEPLVEDLSSGDDIRYRVKCKGVHQSTGIIVGFGVGECSTNEDKYKWRKAVCTEEYEATPETRRRIKWANGRNGVYTITQVRTEPADLANTVLKMAKKRAQIDLTLTSTGASDIFTQDIEDLPDELRQGEDGETGKQTAGTAAGERATSGKPSPDRDKLIGDLEAKADEGWPALQATWAALTEAQRQAVGNEFGRIKKKAEAVRAAN
jgi:hypothetical protein